MNKPAFVDGHPEPSVDFDYDAMDRGNPLTAELEEASPKNDSVTLGKIFSLLLTYGGTDSDQFFITANILAFALGLHPNQGAGGVSIANGLGMEKAAWFRRVNQMRSVLTARGALLPKIAGQWSKRAKQAIKQKTIENHENRKKRKTNGVVIDRIGIAYQRAGIGTGRPLHQCAGVGT